MKINIEDIETKSNETTTSLDNISKIGENDQKYLSIISDITSILNVSKKEKEKEEEVCDKILKYINEGNIDIIKLKDDKNYTIIQKYCLNKEDYHLKCILLCLEKNMSEEQIIKYLLNNDNIDGMNIFEICSDVGELKIFRILKKYLMDNIELLKYLINDNKHGKANIFHYAANKNKINSLLFFYSFYYNNNIHKSILDLKNILSQTPLHICCNQGFYNFSQVLINLGADMNCLDKDKKTPLFYAVQSNSIKIIKFLIISGADKYIKDHKGRLAINYTKDINAINILENKSWFDIACKCKTQFQNLHSHHRHIVMIISLIFTTLFHLYIAIKYKISDFLKKCQFDIDFSFDFIILIIIATLEFLGICFFIFFQFIKTKKININNSKYSKKFCLYESGIEYYEMFKYNENICVKCRRVREMNTIHCISCNVCIDEFDHHCFFLNACINRNNSVYFKIFTIEILITVCANVFISVKFFINLIKEPKIYYGIVLNKCNFNKNKYKFIDYIIYTIDAVYFIVCLYTILCSAIPLMINLIKRKRKENNLNIKDKAKAPLLPIEENNV